MDSPERTTDLYTLLKAEMKQTRSELSVTEGNKEGKSKMEVSSGFARRKGQAWTAEKKPLG